MERGAQVSPGWDAATARRELTGAGVGTGGINTDTTDSYGLVGSRVKTERGRDTRATSIPVNFEDLYPQFSIEAYICAENAFSLQNGQARTTRMHRGVC